MASERPLPFQVTVHQLQSQIEDFVDRVFDALESDFLVLPRGEGFIAFDMFEKGYEAVHAATDGFLALDAGRLFQAVRDVPMGLVVLRTVLGLSPPEWSDVATLTTGVAVGQGFARNLDRAIRKNPDLQVGHTPLQEERIGALLDTACRLLTVSAPETDPDSIHRLEKVDTALGSRSLVRVAREGVSYPSLLYERFLGRPFASHRDSVSEIVGGALEDRIERHLIASGVPFFQTRRAEVLEGWAQNPDFFCPDHRNPVALIEAKMTQDDGTARDKVARVIRLAEMRNACERTGEAGFHVVACIAGRGFGVRRADMKSLLLATRGLVFTASQIDQLAENVDLRRVGDTRDA